jgi:peptide/nickel transport system substrate-binding protein
MPDDQFSNEYGQHLVEEVLSGRMTRRQLLVRASVFGLSASFIGSLLAACGSSTSGTATASPSAAAAAGTPKHGGTLRVAMGLPLSNISPVTMGDPSTPPFVMQMCEYLSWVNDDLSLRPVLAESWKPDPSAKVWTFKLRQGVTFNDGSPFAAEDVVATFERLLNPKSGSSALSALSGILSPGGTVKVDDHTVAFHLDAAFVDFPYLVSSQTYNSLILPRNWSGNFLKNPVGTGPYMLASYSPGQSATLKKNPNYWQKGLPYLDGVVFKFNNDFQAQNLALQAGNVDMQHNTVYNGSQALFSDPNIKILAFPSTAFREVAMRVDTAPFTDKRVRQAVALCLDRPALLQSLLKGYGQLGNDTIFCPLYPIQPVQPAQRKQDYAQAKSLLAAAGHPTGIVATLTTEQYAEIPQYATLLQAMCKPAGIKVNIQLMQTQMYYGGVSNNAPWLSKPMTITDWSPRPTPEQFALPMLRSTGAWTSSHWKNPEFDQALVKYCATLDETSRKQYATQMAAVEYDETPVIISYWMSGLRAARKNVQNLLGPGGVYLDLSNVWLS